MKRQLVSIQAISKTDEWPDLSHIGEYSDKPGPRHKTVVRQERRLGRFYRREPRYFISCNASTQEEAHLDHARMEAYGRGDWWMLGITVKAVVCLTDDRGVSHRHFFESCGLWGIESDSDKAYMEEVARDQYAELVEDLKAFGFTAEEIAAVEFNPYQEA